MLEIPQVRILVSLIIGFGFALMFRKVCKGRCVVVKVPSNEQLAEKYYKMDGECYQYQKETIECEEAGPNDIVYQVE